MPSVVPGYEYDIFISYRQKDNKYDGWVTEFVGNLKKELEATFKEDISIYFDENPHDGLLEMHDVDNSLKSKLKCLVFIPIFSRTYCDPECFAWRNEFAAFNSLALTDGLGSQITLRGGNTTGRVLPIRIHELEPDDVQLVEKELGRKLRPIDFIYKAPGVNRPLRVYEDNPKDNLEKTYYRDQINKVANTIGEIINALKRGQAISSASHSANEVTNNNLPLSPAKTFISELFRRNIFRTAFAYILFSIVAVQIAFIGVHLLKLPNKLPSVMIVVLAALFPLALVLAWIYEASPQGFIRIGSGKSGLNPYTPAQKKPLTGNLIMLVLVLLLIVQNLYIQNLKSSAPDQIVVPVDKSVVVLPFEYRGESPNEYFADGISEDINSLLSRINALRVISPGIYKGNKGTQESYNDLTTNLGVSYILIGSVQLSGNEVRIAPQLIDGRNSDYVWGDVFTVDQKDLFKVQTEIALRVASALNISLTDEERRSLNKKATESFSAYDHYLKGRSYYYQYNAEDNDNAIDYFKRAIATDPNFALAWAGLGDAYNQSFGRFAKGSQWSDSALYASRQAIKLDPALSEGYKSLASAYYYLTRYDTSKLLLEKAVELNPTNVAAVGNLGTAYFMEGAFVQALQMQKRSAGLNPTNFIPYQITGWIYRLLGDLDNAEIWLNRSIELSPKYDTYELLAYTYTCQGKRKEALDLIPLVLKLDENDPLVLETAGLIANFAGDASLAKTYFLRNMQMHEIVNRDPMFSGNIHLAQIYLRENNVVDAEVLLTAALELNMTEIRNGSLERAFPFNVAAIYAIRGKSEEAIHWIDKAIAMNWVDYAQLTHGPLFMSMRNHPELIKRVKQLSNKMQEMKQKAAEM